MNPFERQRRRRLEELMRAGIAADAAAGFLPPAPRAPSGSPSPRALESSFPHAAAVELIIRSTWAVPSAGLAPQSLSAMWDILSLSVLQILSVLSFLTSIIAVLRVGSGSLHRLSHKLGTDFNVPVQAPVTVDALKQHLWSWNGLPPVPFSLGTLIGEDAQERGLKSLLGGYVGGGDLMRMNWQVGRPRFGPPIYDAHAPLSMAKLIMSRHSQRRPPRVPRRAPGMPRPTPPSRLVESVV